MDLSDGIPKQTEQAFETCGIRKTTNAVPKENILFIDSLCP